MILPYLTPAQQKMLDEAEEQLKAVESDTSDEGVDVDTCWGDLVEAAAWEITDPLVRREFYRIQGCIDRQTGYDPMEGV